MEKPAPDKIVFAFRWRYVALPIAILLISIILSAAFYGRLPFPTAYSFASDGSPDAWAIPGLLVFWGLLPQAGLTLGAIIVSWGVSILAGRYLRPENAVVSPQKIMLLTGNMVALPQIIILYALLDIFLYGANQSHLPLPVWIFALIVMMLGGIVLGTFFVQMMRQVWGANKKVI